MPIIPAPAAATTEDSLNNTTTMFLLVWATGTRGTHTVETLIQKWIEIKASLSAQSLP